MKVDLIPCRFCSDPRAHVENDPDPDIYWVECDYCGARGPNSDSEDAALDSWNNGLLARNRYGLATNTRAI